MIVTVARPSLQNGFEFSCLGIVLDQNHIFTRASCIQDDGSSVYSSKASENVIIEDPLAQKRIDGTYSLKIKELYPKASYDTSKNFENFHFDDLLIIQTDEPLWISIPACLPDPEMDPSDPDPEDCWIIWSKGGILDQSRAEFIPNWQCDQYWTANGKIDYQSQFCARSRKASSSMCGGDGAFFCKYRTNFEEEKIVIFGVLVYHVFNDCQRGDNYFVFNRISTQFSFICCTQGGEKYAACKFVNCDDPPLKHLEN